MKKGKENDFSHITEIQFPKIKRIFPKLVSEEITSYNPNKNEDKQDTTRNSKQSD